MMFLGRMIGPSLAIMGAVLCLATPANANDGVSLPTFNVASRVKAGVDAWARNDYESAVTDWQAPAAAGDANAEFDLGQAYKLGRGVPQDLTRAETLFGQAAAQGHVQASDDYGLLLFQRGAHAQAMPYIKAAAARSEPRAEYLLGVAYFDGDSIGRDWVRAYAWELLAQKGGVTQATSALSQMDTYIPLQQRQQGTALASSLGHTSEVAPPSTPMNSRASQTSVAAMPASTHAASVGADYASVPMSSIAVVEPIPKSTKTPTTLAHRHDAKAPAAVLPGAKTIRRGDWMIQLGAFSVPANLTAQWNRVHTMTDVAGHDHRVVPTGKVQRLLVTGYSEASARAACTYLSAKGITCLSTRR